VAILVLDDALSTKDALDFSVAGGTGGDGRLASGEYLTKLGAGGQFDWHMNNSQ
jgi:hypothetical protein